MKEKFWMFIISFVIIFIGMSLANIIGCIIYGFSEGTVFQRIVELPYILYAVFSLIISIVYFFLVFR